MKRLFLSLIIWYWFAGGILFAQVHIGIGGGGGLPQQVVFRAAAPLEISLARHSALRVEAAIAQRGNRFVRGLFTAKREYYLPVITYLEAPLTLMARIPFESFDFFVLAGPQFNYALRLTADYREDHIARREVFDFETLGLHRFDYGLGFGGGIEKSIERGRRIYVEFRYYLGARDLNRGGDAAIHNAGGAFGIGFFMPLGARRE
jgi:hypothetical protein